MQKSLLRRFHIAGPSESQKQNSQTIYSLFESSPTSLSLKVKILSVNSAFWNFHAPLCGMSFGVSFACSGKISERFRGGKVFFHTSLCGNILIFEVLAHRQFRSFAI